MISVIIDPPLPLNIVIMKMNEIIVLSYTLSHLYPFYPNYRVRLAAAGSLRSAVALELATGKVWALPMAVQSGRGTRRRNGTGHSEWVRCHGPRAGAASHHACGREELLRCWADSETRPQGRALRRGLPASLSRARPPCVRRRGGTAGWTQSPGTTLPTA